MLQQQGWLPAARRVWVRTFRDGSGQVSLRQARLSQRRNTILAEKRNRGRRGSFLLFGSGRFGTVPAEA